QRYPRFSVELSAAGLFSPSFGGDIAGGSCAGCSRGPGLGGMAVVRGGYAPSPLVSFGLAAGFLAANQTIAGRATALRPAGLDPRPGIADDTLKLRAGLAGAFVDLAVGPRRFLHLRLGAGVALGTVGDSRTGTFQPPFGPSYHVGPVGDAPFAAFAY